MPDVRRAVLAAGLVLAASAGLPAAAQAHGGQRLVSETRGAYAVSVDVRLRAVPGGRAVLDDTLTLRAARGGRPVAGARVTVTVQTPHGPIGPRLARARGNSYELLLPLTRPADWRSYRFRASIAGPLGAAALAYRAPALGRWQWNQPLVLAGAALALLLYLRGWRRLRARRAGLAGASRLAAFAAGIALVVLAVVSPIDGIGESYLLWVHMVQHVLLGDAAPALLVAGVSGALALFVVPAALLRRLARMPLLPSLARWLLRPGVALAAWALVYGGWHVPALYDAALRRPLVHDVEHLTFLLAGLLVWSQIVDPLPSRQLARSRRIGTALVLFGLGMLLSDVLIFSFHPLYGAYASQPERLLGLSPMADQRLAGLVMILEQTVTVGTALLLLLRMDGAPTRRSRARRTGSWPASPASVSDPAGRTSS